MWEELVYTKAQAKYKFQQLKEEREDCKPRYVNTVFNELRKAVLCEREIFLSNHSKKIQSHAYDLHLGLFLYRVLNEQHNFTERLASQDETWRYLSLEIFPDLVYERYGMEEVRFYKSTRRIWLRNIWWYVHLSWQGSIEDTFTILHRNSSDEMLQLIDRAGNAGYRLELTRELMKQNSWYLDSKIPLLFRRVLKLNTARLNIVEPNLVEGGVQKYVEDLYRYFLINA